MMLPRRIRFMHLREAARRFGLSEEEIEAKCRLYRGATGQLRIVRPEDIDRLKEEGGVR